MKKKQTTPTLPAKKTPTGRVASLAATATGSSRDTALLVGGLALVFLVLGDTIFLAFTTRFVRF